MCEEKLRNRNESDESLDLSTTKMVAEGESTETQEEALSEGERVTEFGQLTLDKNEKKHKIHLLSIIGEIEGHECLPAHTKTTKYEHVLPQLAAIEDNQEIEGLLILLNTVGGDVEAGLAIGEMISSLSIPTVSLVLGGSHSIGVPLAVSTDHSFIVPSATMIVHPVRMSGTVIGVSQTYNYFQKIQDRIVEFIIRNSKITSNRFQELMVSTDTLAKDVGSILIGKQSVEEGLINEVGGIKEAIACLYQLIEERNQKK